jgi:hypothetical protein
MLEERSEIEGGEVNDVSGDDSAGASVNEGALSWVSG